MTDKLLLQLKSYKIIDLLQVIHMRSDGHYIEIHTTEQKNTLIERDTLTQMIDRLPNNLFIRVHRSHIINLYHLQEFNSQKAIMTNGDVIPLSRSIKLSDYIPRDRSNNPN